MNYQKKQSINILSPSLACFLIFTILGPPLFSQGCLPSRHIPPNIGENGQSYLVNGQWEAGISYRFLYSNTFFIGTEPQHEYKERGENAMLHHHSFNLSARYAVNQRLSISANIPIIHAQESDIHFDGMRHLQKPGTQLGDMRIVANYWLNDPAKLPKGNISIGLGLKLPTGNEELEGTFYTFSGPQTRDYDIALQPGDGGLGIIVEANGFHSITDRISTYAGVHYVINPRNTNNSLAQWFEPGDPYTSDSPDQYNLRGGMTVAFGSFAINVGLRFDGIPLNDLIGESDGFRRPGNLLYLDNGIMWSDITNTVSLSLPYALRRNIITSNMDASFGIETLGGLADFLTLVGYTRRF